MKIFSSLFCLVIVSCSSAKVLENPGRYQIDRKLVEEVQLQVEVRRAPAALAKEVHPSTKRVYFKTLYQQYLTYSQLSQLPRQIKHCPAFHSDFLETQAITTSITLRVAKKEISFLQRELSELCDKGVSAQYYRFENLVNYHVNKKSFHQDPMSIFSLLKIPVFHHMYELKTTYGIAAEFPQLVQLTQTYWFASYLEHYKIKETSLVRR